MTPRRNRRRRTPKSPEQIPEHLHAARSEDPHGPTMHSPIRTNCVILGSPPMNRSDVIDPQPKAEVLPPRNAMALDTLAGVRGEMARLYRLGLNGRIRSDEMTRFIYALKEIRACLEAETPDRRAASAGLAVARHGQPQWSTRPSSAGFHRPLTRSSSGASRTVR